MSRLEEHRHDAQLSLSAIAAADDVASKIVPPVTVVLEGRCICHRIRLDQHADYESLAKALHRMFVDVNESYGYGHEEREGLDLSNAVPGHVVAYEDMEDDLLLVGDLQWKWVEKPYVYSHFIKKKNY